MVKNNKVVLASDDVSGVLHNVLMDRRIYSMSEEQCSLSDITRELGCNSAFSDVSVRIKSYTKNSQENRFECVRIYTDASSKNQRDIAVAGGGALMLGQDDKLKSAVFIEMESPEFYISSLDAEAISIMVSIMLSKRMANTTIEEVLTDSKEAIYHLKNIAPVISEEEVISWCRGHGTSSANNFADRMAKSARNSAEISYSYDRGSPKKTRSLNNEVIPGNFELDNTIYKDDAMTVSARTSPELFSTVSDIVLMAHEASATKLAYTVLKFSGDTLCSVHRRAIESQGQPLEVKAIEVLRQVLGENLSGSVKLHFSENLHDIYEAGKLNIFNTEGHYDFFSSMQEIGVEPERQNFLSEIHLPELHRYRNKHALRYISEHLDEHKLTAHMAPVVIADDKMATVKIEGKRTMHEQGL